MQKDGRTIFFFMNQCYLWRSMQKGVPTGD